MILAKRLKGIWMKIFLFLQFLSEMSRGKKICVKLLTQKTRKGRKAWIGKVGSNSGRLKSLILLFKVVGESGSDDMTGLGNPYFQSGEVGSRVNVTTQLGDTTYLHCRVNRLGGSVVSTT